MVCASSRAVAQDAPRLAAPNRACVELNRTVIAQASNGQLKDAELSLSGTLADMTNGVSQSCEWIILQNMAVVVSRSGHPEVAESYAYRSVGILERNYPPDDPILLRPLHMLAAVRFQQGKLAAAREAFQRMQRIPISLPLDRALLHGSAAALFHSEGRHAEAEKEYLSAISDWEEAGRGKTADEAAVLNGLTDLYIVDGRFDEASKTLDRALAIFAVATDVGLADRIRVLNSQAVLHAKGGQWRKAEGDLRTALSLADPGGLSPLELEPLLDNYAVVLARNHRTREARSVAARADAIRSSGLAGAIVDASQLLAESKSAGK